MIDFIKLNYLFAALTLSFDKMSCLSALSAFKTEDFWRLSAHSLTDQAPKKVTLVQIDSCQSMTHSSPSKVSPSCPCCWSRRAQNFVCSAHSARARKVHHSRVATTDFCRKDLASFCFSSEKSNHQIHSIALPNQGTRRGRHLEIG